MSGSAAEREISDDAATRLRQMIPEALIIHELVMGGSRADLAADEPDRLTLVESKSRKDTLKRLTAEIAILNKSAVALAADSAVTIPSEEGQDKIFDSADKLFELTPGNPIAIMINNDMSLM